MKITDMFLRLSVAGCKYHEPCMPVYEEPNGECLYNGQTGEIEICCEYKCPLLVNNDNKEMECIDCGHEFDIDEAATYDIDMDELGKVTACPGCNAINVDVNTPPAPLQYKNKQEV